MTSNIFPSPRVFRELHHLIKRDFGKYLQTDYSETPQFTGTGLEREVIKLLENYSEADGFRVHLTNENQTRGFAGLLHKFDAGVEDRTDLSQCLFEVKYRGSSVTLEQEDIMKFHHATFEYFLKLLAEKRWDEANVFRCFVTTKEVRDSHRQFFYAWGIVLVDPKFVPLPIMSKRFEALQQKGGITDYTLSLIERANRLTEQAYFSLAELVPPEQKYANILDLSKLNPAVDSAKILVEHQFLQNEYTILKQKYLGSKYQ